VVEATGVHAQQQVMMPWSCVALPTGTPKLSAFTAGSPCWALRCVLPALIALHLFLALALALRVQSDWRSTVVSCVKFPTCGPNPLRLLVQGVLVPELLASVGGGGPAAATPWFEAGKFEYFADAKSLFAVQMLLFAWAESRRLQVKDRNCPAMFPMLFPRKRVAQCFS
jgi:hypothetical protein